MNGIAVIVVSLLCFGAGYALYGRRMERLMRVDPGRKTPAVANYDGVDYVPAKHWSVLFGHHFSSIAGAGPIVGPILAAAIWGWLPAVIWIVAGTIFIGGVHDFCSLVVSARHDGTSITDVAGDTISRPARIIFMSFVWITLILIISVFAHLTAKTFVVQPNIVIPSLGLIPIAMLVGFLLYNRKINQPLVTVFGLALLLATWILGSRVFVTLGVNALTIWGVLLLAYAFIASVLPVQFLLQPRDYLSSFLLLLGLIFGYAGLFVSSPQISYPAYTGWNPKEGLLWPALFITVACGAISGFHSLVASGTSSKQLASEADARKIGYGGMVAEGLVAIMAVMMIAIAFREKPDLMGLLGKGGAGPIGVFGRAYGAATRKFLGGFGWFFAITILNAFILTTLDTATRIGRYLTQELFNVRNKYAATLLVVALSGWLGLSGEWMQIWPLFGAANQLIAALALVVISGWLLLRKRAIGFTVIPAAFMLVTAIGALSLKIIEYSREGKYILLPVASILLCMAFFITWESIRHLRVKHKTRTFRDI